MLRDTRISQLCLDGNPMTASQLQDFDGVDDLVKKTAAGRNKDLAVYTIAEGGQGLCGLK